jgi:hypothetical protein
MRRFAPIVALTLVASTTFFGAAARADEGQPVAPNSAPTEAAPEMVPPPPSPSTERSTMKRPTTVREFEAARSELRERFEGARVTSLRARAGASRDEEDRIREELSTLERWLDEDTERTNASGFVAGIVMLSLGGSAAVLGGSVLGSVVYDKGADVVPVGAGLLGSGLAAAGIGIALIVSGSPRVMKAKAQSTTSLFAPSARLLVGPGTMGVGGTF